MSEEHPVTSLEDMRAQALGEVVEIPGWVPGKVVHVRLRKVDLTAHILAAGPIPNILVGAVGEAFGDQPGGAPKNRAPSPEDIQQMLPVFEVVAREAMIEPKYDQVVAEVAPLTLDQKLAIFDYATGTLKAARPFRGQRTPDVGSGGRAHVGGKTK